MDHGIMHGKSSKKIEYNFAFGYFGLLKDVFCKELKYQQGNKNLLKMVGTVMAALTLVCYTTLLLSLI